MPTRQVTIQGVMTWDENYPSQGPGFPTHPIAPGGPPPGLWPGQGQPSHPIAGPPPGIWPSPGHPSHPIAPGGGPSQGPGFPTHPIAPGGPPLDVWPSPGHPANPISGGGYVIGWSPQYGWVFLPLGGANPPQTGEPTHPIAPGGEPPKPSQGPGMPTNPIAGPPQPEPKAGDAKRTFGG